jgi:hypothetical protein
MSYTHRKHNILLDVTLVTLLSPPRKEKSTEKLGVRMSNRLLKIAVNVVLGNKR